MIEITLPGADPAQAPPPADSGATQTTITAGATAGDEPAAPGRDEARYRPTLLEIGSGVALLMVWALIFSFGIVFSSEPFRNALEAGRGEISWSRWFPSNFAMFLLTYTVTNVAILCCISAWLGELGRRTRIDGANQSGSFQRGDYVAAVMRGFLAYLATLTGYVVIGSGVNIFVTPSPESYVRLAAIVSLAGFLVGFKPALFRRFEESAIGRVISETHADGSTRRTIEGPARVEEVTTPDPPAARHDAPNHQANGPGPGANSEPGS